jgi:hypothetical protein
VFSIPALKFRPEKFSRESTETTKSSRFFLLPTLGSIKAIAFTVESLKPTTVLKK